MAKYFEYEDVTVLAPPPDKIKKCPCCGKEAEIEGSTMYYGVPGVVISCPKCQVRTLPVTAGLYLFYRGKKNVTFTIEQAVDEVLDTWNNRITIEQHIIAGGDSNA